MSSSFSISPDGQHLNHVCDHGACRCGEKGMLIVDDIVSITRTQPHVGRCSVRIAKEHTSGDKGSKSGHTFHYDQPDLPPWELLRVVAALVKARTGRTVEMS